MQTVAINANRPSLRLNSKRMMNHPPFKRAYLRGLKDAAAGPLQRTAFNTLYYHVNNVATFLPAAGWSANMVSAGVIGPLNFDLAGQGVRDIGWFPNLGLDGNGAAIGRYLILGGPANGGPLEKEIVGEVFSLWSWQGPGGPAPVRVIADLRPYTVRPEAITVIQVNGQSRVLFGEDRFRAVGYGTRNAIHWPLSILGNPLNL